MGDGWCYLYGESAGTWHPNHLLYTKQILQAVAAQVCLQSSGLRVVAGDFNVGEDDVTAFNILHASGFKDLQSDGDVRSPTLAKALPGLISATLAQDSNSCSFRFLWTMVCGQTMRFWRVSSRDPIVIYPIISQYWCVEPMGICQFCSFPDSRYHWFWQCEMFSQHRHQVHPMVWKIIPQLPLFLTCYGWSLLPATWGSFLRALLAIHEPAPNLPGALPAQQGWMDLFTDGSCHYPRMPWRLASVAVVQADPTHLGVDTMHSIVLAARPLKGLEALRIGRDLKCRVRLWCDCQGIGSRIQKLQAGNCVSGRMAAIPTAGLKWLSWFLKWDLSPLVSLRWPVIRMDHVANVAHVMRTHAFHELHDRFIADARYAMFVSREVQGVLLAISRAFVQHQAMVEAEELTHPVEPEPKRQPDGMNVVDLAPLHWAPMRWCERFGERIAVKIATWFQQACSNASNSRAQWISSCQLYCDYMLCSGEGGPIKEDQWIDPCQRPHADLLDISFKLRCRWFTHLVKELWKEWQYKIQVAFARPHSETLILHASCAWLRWPTFRMDRVEAWMSAHLQGPAKRDGRQLQRLPTAVKDREMPEISGIMEVR